MKIFTNPSIKVEGFPKALMFQEILDILEGASSLEEWEREFNLANQEWEKRSNYAKFCWRQLESRSPLEAAIKKAVLAKAVLAKTEAKKRLEQAAKRLGFQQQRRIALEEAMKTLIG